MSTQREGHEGPRAAPAGGSSSGGAPSSTPHTAEASNFLKMMTLCDDSMFSVLMMEDDGACTALFMSPGVKQLLGFTQEEYLALGCVASRCAARGRGC